MNFAKLPEHHKYRQEKLGFIQKESALNHKSEGI